MPTAAQAGQSGSLHTVASSRLDHRDSDRQAGVVNIGKGLSVRARPTWRSITQPQAARPRTSSVMVHAQCESHGAYRAMRPAILSLTAWGDRELAAC